MLNLFVFHFKDIFSNPSLPVLLPPLLLLLANQQPRTQYIIPIPHINRPRILYILYIHPRQLELRIQTLINLPHLLNPRLLVVLQYPLNIQLPVDLLLRSLRDECRPQRLPVEVLALIHRPGVQTLLVIAALGEGGVERLDVLDRLDGLLLVAISGQAAEGADVGVLGLLDVCVVVEGQVGVLFSDSALGHDLRETHVFLSGVESVADLVQSFDPLFDGLFLLEDVDFGGFGDLFCGFAG